MKICEWFYSIQGEGKTAGKPSLFLRTSGCTLKCEYCDTKYHKREVKNLTPEHMADIIGTELIDKDCHNLVITGGEPLLQQKELFLMLKKLNEKYSHAVTYTVEVETNGTIIPTDKIDTFIDQYNVSIKLISSKNKTDKRLKKDSIRHFVGCSNANFKFVIDTDSDLTEVLELMSVFKIPKHKIWLMPQGQTKKEQEAKQSSVIDICKEYGFNFSPRLHILVWDRGRGV